MADSDSTLKILIQLGVVGQGDVEAANQLLKETGQGAADSLKGMNESMPENLKAWQGMRKSLGEAGEGMGGMEEHIHSLRALMAKAGPEAEEFGHLLHFLSNPIMLGGALGAAAEEAYFHVLERREEKYKSLLDLSQKLNDSVREIINSGQTEDEMFVDFNKTLAAAQQNARGLSFDLSVDKQFADLAAEGMNVALDRVTQLHKSTASVQSRLVDMFVAMGKLKPGEGDQLKQQIEHAAKLKEMDDERAKAAADISAKQTQYDIARNDVARYGNETSILRQKQQADFAADRNESIITNYNKVKKSFEEANNAAEAATKNSTVDSEARNRAWALSDGLKGQMDAMRDQYNNARAQSLPLESQRAQADKLWTDFEAAKETIKGFHDELEKARQSLMGINAANSAKAATENREFGVDQATKLFKGGGTVSSVFADGTRAMLELSQMKDKTGFTPADFLQRGNAQQFDYVRHLQNQVEALKALENAVGNNGDSVIGAINNVMQTVAKGAGSMADINAWCVRLQQQYDQLSRHALQRPL